MKRIIFKCALISCICVLNLVSSASIIISSKEEGSGNFTDLLTQYNFSIPLSNVSNLSEAFPGCVLQKIENDFLLIINKTRAEVGEHEYPDYEQVCPVVPYMYINTMDSLIGK